MSQLRIQISSDLQLDQHHLLGVTSTHFMLFPPVCTPHDQCVSFLCNWLDNKQKFVTDSIHNGTHVTCASMQE